jgi:hypothetical protein
MSIYGVLFSGLIDGLFIAWLYYRDRKLERRIDALEQRLLSGSEPVRYAVPRFYRNNEVKD